MIKRLGIFAFYNQEGCVYQYIQKLLQEVKSCIDYLVVVCNGHVREDSLVILRAIADDVFCRENRAYDAGAYKVALERIIGWEKVRRYDQVLLFNNSFFGPFYPLENVFMEMVKKNFDFWGITGHSDFCVDGVSGEKHIQSYFLVINQNLLRAKDFEDYWGQLDTEMNSLQDAIASFEMTFTNFFSERGYRWGVYADSSIFDGNKERPCNPYLYESFYLISEKKMPFLKCKNFTFFDNYRSNNEDLKRTISFIEKNTDYDTSLIWDYVLQNYKLTEISKSYGLTVVLPSDYTDVRRQYVAAVFVIHCKETFYEVKKCFNCLNESDNIYIIYDEDSVKNLYGELKRKNIEFIDKRKMDSERWVELLQSICKENEYICIMEDAAIQNTYDTVESGSDLYRIRENLFSSSEFVDNAVQHMESNTCLGILKVPSSSGILREWDAVAEWQSYKQTVKQVIQNYFPGKIIDDEDYSEFHDAAFWIRSELLAALLTPGVFRIAKKALLLSLPFLAKYSGYYTETLRSTQYAEIELNLQKEYIRNVKGCKTAFFIQLLSAMHHSRNYIWGTGIYANEAAAVLMKSGIKIEGFITVSGEIAPSGNIPVFQESEIVDFLKEAVVIVAVHGQEQERVQQYLWRMGCTSVLLY